MVVNLDWNLVVSFNRNRWSIYAGIRWSISPFFPVKQGELKQGLIKIKIPKKDLTSYKVPVDLEIKEAKGKPIDDYVISFMAPF